MFVQKENFGSLDEFRCRMHVTNYNYAAHIHQYAELMVVCEGEIEVTVNGITETARAGDFIFIFPLQSHSYRTPEFSRVWNSVFSASLLFDFLQSHRGQGGGNAVFQVSDVCAEYFQRTMMKDRPDGSLPDLYQIKSCLYAAAACYPVLPEAVPATREKDFIAAVSSYLDTHFRENIGLDELADALGYNANYLSHRLHRCFHLNFRSLLNSFRLDHAKYLLRTGAKTILEIALECGFENERSFYRAFLREIGMTPGEYRHTHALILPQKNKKGAT